MKKAILVTGGAGFIGSAFVREALKAYDQVVIYDKLTYAGHRENFQDLLEKGRCEFVQQDICDRQIVLETLKNYQVTQIVHFAAESHVDNSISGPQAFVQTNVIGTFSLLEAAREYWSSCSGAVKNHFRFVHVSTDEVFGALGKEGQFTEKTPYQPNSPYSATKAASDHLVRAWFHTYHLPVVTTNCSNNYGPRQFPEKLIPVVILNALQEKKLPVYGNGLNIRDWIHVEDHSRGVLLALEKGQLGESYCFGGNAERTNLQVVQSICKILDHKKPRASGQKYADLITFVEDRKGHDFRYSIDDSKSQKELGFTREFTTFETGLEKTITWYLNNSDWITSVKRKQK